MSWGLPHQRPWMPWPMSLWTAQSALPAASVQQVMICLKKNAHTHTQSHITAILFVTNSFLRWWKVINYLLLLGKTLAKQLDATGANWELRSVGACCSDSQAAWHKGPIRWVQAKEKQTNLRSVESIWMICLLRWSSPKQTSVGVPYWGWLWLPLIIWYYYVLLYIYI